MRLHGRQTGKMGLKIGEGVKGVACLAWRFLSNLRAIGKRESRDKERQSSEEPRREFPLKAMQAMKGETYWKIFLSWEEAYVLP